jgi:hypothetical protein
VPDVDTDAAAVREQSLQELAARAIGALESAGFDHRTAVPLVAPPRTGLLLANSAVVPLIATGWNELHDHPFAVVQPCFRAHNLDLWAHGAYSGEWLSAFSMLGAFTTDVDRACAATEAILTAAETGSGGRYRVKAAARDASLAAALEARFNRSEQRASMAIDEPVPEHQRGWKPAYYDWTFGPSGLVGRGITVALEQADGRWRDLGNLIAFTHDGLLVGYGVGIGLETLAAASHSAPSLIDVTGAGAVLPTSMPGEIAFADFARALVVLRAWGVQPRSRGVGNLMRRIGNVVRALALEHGRGIGAVRACLNAVAEATFPPLVPPGSQAGAGGLVDAVYPSARYIRHVFSFTLEGPAHRAEAVARTRWERHPGGSDGCWTIDEVRWHPDSPIGSSGAERSVLDFAVTCEITGRSGCFQALSSQVRAEARVAGLAVVGLDR